MGLKETRAAAADGMKAPDTAGIIRRPGGFEAK